MSEREFRELLLTTKKYHVAKSDFFGELVHWYQPDRTKRWCCSFKELFLNVGQRLRQRRSGGEISERDDTKDDWPTKLG